MRYSIIKYIFVSQLKFEEQINLKYITMTRNFRRMIRKFNIKLNKILWRIIINGIKYAVIFFFLLILLCITIFLSVFWEREISTDIADWGNFSMFISGIFAVLSVFLLYATFLKQLAAAKEQRKYAIRQRHEAKEQSKIYLKTSFNMLFANRLSIQRKLYNKISPESFLSMHNRIDSYLRGFSGCSEPENKHKIIQDAYNNAFGMRERDKDINVYFKFLYHTIMYVHNTNYMTKEEKKNLLSLLQAQMNTHELFCYIINVLDANNKNFISIIDEYNFFEDLGVDNQIFNLYIKDYFKNTKFFKINPDIQVF